MKSANSFVLNVSCITYKRADRMPPTTRKGGTNESTQETGGKKGKGGAKKRDKVTKTKNKVCPTPRVSKRAGKGTTSKNVHNIPDIDVPPSPPSQESQSAASVATLQELLLQEEELTRQMLIKEAKDRVSKLTGQLAGNGPQNSLPEEPSSWSNTNNQHGGGMPPMPSHSQGSNVEVFAEMQQQMEQQQ